MGLGGNSKTQWQWVTEISRYLSDLDSNRAILPVLWRDPEKAQLAVTEAQKRTLETLQRAEKAETAIRQAKAIPDIKGRLVRWLAGDVLPD